MARSCLKGKLKERQCLKGIASSGKEVLSAVPWCSFLKQQWKKKKKKRQLYHSTGKVIIKSALNKVKKQKIRALFKNPGKKTLEQSPGKKLGQIFPHSFVNEFPQFKTDTVSLRENMPSRFSGSLNRFFFPLLSCTFAKRLMADTEELPASSLNWQISLGPLILGLMNIYRFNQQSILAETCGGIKVRQQ